MIEQIKIKNFQSLHDVTLDVGRFTVIVGSSSSGKSALVRALKAVSSNDLASDYITRGAKSCSISIKSNDSTVTIQREIGASSVYKIAKSGSQVQDFKKLNRSVPTEVTKALGISPSTQEVESINFAGQFDAPYLLKDSASVVARVLGELTNVSTIFAAVKEANRRAKNSSGLVNVRKKDEESLRTELKAYNNLAKDVKSIQSAKAIYLEVQQLAANINNLKTLSSQLEGFEEALIDKDYNIPDIEELEQLNSKLKRFKSLVSTVLKTKQLLTDKQIEIEGSNSALLEAENQLHNLLVTQGQCPTCHQIIK